MIEKVVKLRDAFGVGRDEPLNYVEREGVDGRFLESLTRDKHVVIYGSSKQGKTTLRKHGLNDEDYIVISCLNSMALDDLHAAILKAAGYRIEQTQTKTVGGKWKYGAEFKGEGKVPLIAAGSGMVSLGHEASKEDSKEATRLELDLFDVNDIIAALSEIKFENLSYLRISITFPSRLNEIFRLPLRRFMKIQTRVSSWLACGVIRID